MIGRNASHKFVGHRVDTVGKKLPFGRRHFSPRCSREMLVYCLGQMRPEFQALNRVHQSLNLVGAKAVTRTVCSSVDSYCVHSAFIHFQFDVELSSPSCTCVAVEDWGWHDETSAHFELGRLTEYPLSGLKLLTKFVQTCYRQIAFWKGNAFSSMIT